MDLTENTVDALPNRIPQVLEVIKWPNPLLNQKSSYVINEIGSKELSNFIDDMLETARANKALGLSAIQVGINKRIIVINDGVAMVNNNGEIVRYQTELVFINPVLSNFEGNTFTKEGCLSMPGIFECVKRYEGVTVNGLDRNGNKVSYNLISGLAKSIQHEVDHLDGVMFFDRTNSIRRHSIIKKYRRLSR